jgi:hypothetical protein
MKITLYKNGMSRPAQLEDVERFQEAGWTQDSNGLVDSGAVKLKAPKKKKAEEPAEIEPDAAIEDLDNANQGE